MAMGTLSIGISQPWPSGVLVSENVEVLASHLNLAEIYIDLLDHPSPVE
jgi:hypothetical protein